MLSPDLLILRHGETVWNCAGRIQGAADSPLTAFGRDQAAAQGRLLATFDLSVFQIWTSPQGSRDRNCTHRLAGTETPDTARFTPSRDYNG